MREAADRKQASRTDAAAQSSASTDLSPSEPSAFDPSPSAILPSCNSALSMLMTGHGRRGRERQRRARVRHVVLLQQLLDARHVRAHERLVGNHHRLVTVADVIGEQRPLRTRVRGSIDEDRLRRARPPPRSGARRRARGSRRRAAPMPRGSDVPNSTPPSVRRRPCTCVRSSQPSVTVSRANARDGVRQLALLEHALDDGHEIHGESSKHRHPEGSALSHPRSAPSTLIPDRASTA